MRVVADESVDYGIITYLKKNGFEILAIEDLHKGSTDEEVLNFSLIENSLLLTEDKDFGELVFRLKKAHIGIVLIRLHGVDLEIKNKIIIRSLKENMNEMKNSFSVISSNQTRIHKQ